MSQLFQTVASQFQSANQYQKFIRECEKEYDIKVYHLNTFTVTYARKIYSELAEKYHQRHLEPNPCGWYENQRRLYVWFVLCFMHYKVLDPFKFVDTSEKYWRLLSELFWQKEIYFLKYQLLNLFKAKGRIVWKAKEDQLLKAVFKQFKFGEWNEIAKQFYRLSNGEFFKTPKQCRERWQNHLNEGIRKGDWSAQEDLVIFQFISENPDKKKWAQVVKKLNETRTEHMIKNRYKSRITKKMAEEDVRENEAIKLILDELKGNKVPAVRKGKNGDQDWQIEEAVSEMLMEEGAKEDVVKVEMGVPKPQQFFIDSSCRMEGRDSQHFVLWDNMVRCDSMSLLNRSMSNFSSSMMFLESGKFMRPFPLMEMPKDDRKNTIFDANESFKSSNSAKNVDSIIVKNPL